MAGKNGGAPLSDVVEEARALMARDPDVTAVHIIDAREVDAFERFWVESMAEAAELRIERGHPNSWKLVRAAAELTAAETRRESLRVRTARKLASIEQWAFEGLSEGAR
jgi:hypothetical protein